MSRSVSASFLIILLGGIGSYLVYDATSSADLLASWLAGVFYQNGALDQIYPPDSVAFTMLPPPAWIPYLRAQGYQDAVFPFIYPPIWAQLFAWLGRVTDFAHVARAASFLNPVLLGSMALLAWRICNSRMPAARFTVVGMLVLFGTAPGMVALFQNQPQILVSFLMLLAVERSRAGAPVAAGAALALAASVKLYPAVFALLWLAGGNRRAFGWFLLFGGGFGALSVALTGWPLHQIFLHQIAVINRTVLVTGFTFSLDPMLGQLFFHHQLQFIQAPGVAGGGPDPGGWEIMVKPRLWRIFSALLMAAVLGRVAMMMRARAAADRALLWPLAFSLFALVSPLSWGYHYLPAIAFAPVFLERFGARGGALILLALFVPLTLPALATYKDFGPYLGDISQPAQLIGTLMMAAYALALARAAKSAPETG